MREPILMACVGKKGVGKSWQNQILMNEYVAGDPYQGIKGRKVLIMDVNDEYGVFNVPPISLEHIALFSVHPQIEIRRVRPFHPDGRRLTLDEWSQALFYVLTRFQNGLLLIEDINKFVFDHMPSDLVGAICTNRHVGLDILVSYQSLGRITTKLWGNLNVLRFHKNNESVERHAVKFPDKVEFMSIAEIIVDTMYDSNVDKRFFVYVDLDESKIQGQLLTDEMKAHAVEQFLYQNKKLLNPILVQLDPQTKKKYTAEGAFAYLRNKMLKDYF